MMNRKDGSMTIKKIIYLILAIVVLLIAVGILTGSLSPLKEQAAGLFDEFLLLIGANNNGGDGDCNERRETIPDGATGVVISCIDSCAFVSDSENFLGANKLMISDDGLKAWMIKDEKWKDVDSWGNDLELSEKHRDAFLELKDVSDRFFSEESEEKTKEEFFVPMEFDSAGTLEYILGGYTVFRWNGDRWERVAGEYVSYHNDDEVLEEIYDWYKSGKDLFWHYRGDEKLNIPMSEFNKNFAKERYTEEELKAWFNGKVEGIINSEDKNTAFYVEIKDLWPNTVYFFKDGSWSKSRLLWDSHHGHEDVFNKIYEAHLDEKRITWHFAGDKINYVPVSDTKILSRESPSGEEEFIKWFNEKRDDWTEKNDAQMDLLSDFSDFLENEGSINLNGEDIQIKVGWRHYLYKTTINYGPVIYFELLNGEKFGLYYEEEAISLAYGDLFKESIANEVVGFSDSEWKEFTKANKIYEYLVEKCRK